ncbi:ferric uptake regulator family protein [Mycobacterium ulcerans str. Harvey]|uniref:Ferric uptake regulator family protein n=1 Tax=Mycobacterium ulcerans str. Harvey TaxID=1299332 RepID=A0ABN0QZ69_MYCUL|nr:ferric uptake regulator family protein [Mycobacterium ulcerans str. Harvey]
MLEAVGDHPHADTETIYSAVREILPDVSRQAVYDVLGALTSVGLVRRIQPSGSVARYESRVGDNHHHVVCRSCGAIADIDCAVGEAPCLAPRTTAMCWMASLSTRPKSFFGACAPIVQPQCPVTAVIAARFTHPWKECCVIR